MNKEETSNSKQVRNQPYKTKKMTSSENTKNKKKTIVI